MTTHRNLGSVPQRPAPLLALLAILAVGVTPYADAAAVVSWGWGGSGSVLTNVPADLSNVVAVTAGPGHSLALRADGTVVGWGASNAPPWPYAGRLDIPSDLLHDAVAVAAGVEHSLALRANGTVLGWGTIFNGDPWVPFRVPAGLSNVVAIATGTFHSMALKTDGTVTTWGAFFRRRNDPLLRKQRGGDRRGNTDAWTLWWSLFGAAIRWHCRRVGLPRWTAYYPSRADEHRRHCLWQCSQYRAPRGRHRRGLGRQRFRPDGCSPGLEQRGGDRRGVQAQSRAAVGWPYRWLGQ